MKQIVVAAFFLMLSNAFAQVPHPQPIPHPGPNPIPLPDPVLYPVTCMTSNPRALAREAVEPGKPAYIFPDDTRLSLGDFLKTLPDGATVQLRAGTFRTDATIASLPRELKRLHLVGRGSSQTFLQGAIALREGSSVEHLGMLNVTGGVPRNTIDIWGSYARVTNVNIVGGAVGVAVGVADWAADPSLPSPGPLSAMSVIACVHTQHTTVAGVSHCGNGGWGDGSILRDIEVHTSTDMGICFAGDRLEYTRLHVVGGRVGIAVVGNSASIDQVRVENTTNIGLELGGHYDTVNHSSFDDIGITGIAIEGHNGRVLNTTIHKVQHFGIDIMNANTTVDHVRISTVLDLTKGAGVRISRSGANDAVTNSSFTTMQYGIVDLAPRGSTFLGNTFTNIFGRNISTTP